MSSGKNCLGSDAEVTKRLFTILVLISALMCFFGGYMLGRMARKEVKRNNEILTFNLSTAADIMYIKAKGISPKAAHNHDADVIRNKLLDIFDCTNCNCSPILDKYNIGDFIKNALNVHVAKLMKSVYNATSYLDSLS